MKILKKDFILVNALLGGVLLAVFISLLLQRWHILPQTHCLMYQTIHMYCPGCGGTRALFAMLHGHIIQSICYNPIVVLGMLLTLHYEIGVLLTLIKKNGRIYYYRKAWLPCLCVAAVLVFAVLRDILLVCCHIDMLKW